MKLKSEEAIAMKLIVLAPEDDNHTAPIKWALEKAGHRVVCWAGLSWTENGQASLIMNQDDTLVLGGHSVDPGDVVWIRRPELPESNPKVSEADKKFASLEYRSFYHSIAYILETLPVWCINRYSAARVMIQKAVQLRLARQCGLKTPATLMSNHPATVREFFARENSRTICKGFTPHVWQKEGQKSVAITETFELTRDQLPNDEVLTYAPAIYQERVPKDYDIRMVLMGNQIYSYALRNTKQALDWRQDAGLGHVTAELVPTPPDVEKGVLEFARRSGLCFGSLDFGVDAQGQWWYLEINEQGQFLWIDQFNREARLLEKFCAFVTSPQGSTVPVEARQDLFPSLAEYEELLKNEQVAPVGRPRQEDPFLSLEA
jgi:glutathione synthase/RimK-type ligase-like ATP-grasp enzyme